MSQLMHLIVEQKTNAGKSFRNFASTRKLVEKERRENLVRTIQKVIVLQQAENSRNGIVIWLAGTPNETMIATHFDANGHFLAEVNPNKSRIST